MAARWPRLLLILVLIMGSWFFCSPERPGVPLQASGLEAALSLLQPGKQLSPRWWALLEQSLDRVTRLYASSLKAPVPQATLDDLVLESSRAESSVRNIIDLEPLDSTQLQKGLDLMLSQLSVWQLDVLQRCGLKDTPVRLR